MNRHWLFSVNISFDAFKWSLLALKNIWRVVSYIQGLCNYLGGSRRSIECAMIKFTIVIFTCDSWLQSLCMGCLCWFWTHRLLPLTIFGVIFVTCVYGTWRIDWLRISPGAPPSRIITLIWYTRFVPSHLIPFFSNWLFLVQRQNRYAWKSN